MADPEQTTINDSYVQWQRIFWLMLVLLCAVSALLVWNAHVRNTNAQALQANMVQGGVTGAAHEITLHIQALRTAVRLFAEKERALLQRLAADPNNVDIYEELLKHVKVYFNDGFAVTLADDRGDPVVADFDGFVGQLCQADLRTFTQSAFVMPDIYIHPNAIGYHFDIMASVDLSAHKPHIFFISFYPRMIASILSRYQLTGHQLLLLDREVNGLIEVDIQGSRDTMRRDYFISDSERARILFSAPVENTRWQLVDFSSAGQRDVGQGVWQETVVAITALVLLSMYFLSTLRLHMRRIDVQNATLRAQAQEIQARSGQVINILERTTDAYVEFDAHWHCTYLNRQAGKLLDQAPDLVVGQDIWAAFPDLAAAFYKDMQKAQAEGAVQVFSGFYPPSQRWLEMHVHPMPDRMTVFMRDVTQERATWERAKDSEARNQAILDHVADAIVTIDKDGSIETFNPAAEQVFQYRAAEVIGKNVKILMPDVDRDHHDQYIAQYSTTGSGGMIDKTRELLGKRKDGRLFPVELCVTRVKVHDRDIFIAALRDISVRKESESRIRELARFPDENPAPVMRVGADGVISYANGPAAILLRAWETTVNGDVPAGVLRMVRDALAAAAPIEYETTCSGRVYLLAFMPVPEGNYVNVRGDDITDRKRAELELKNHRDNLEELVIERTTALVMAHNDVLVASRAKSAFLASMSHELRTPLNAIIGYSEMLEETSVEEGNERLREDLRKITASGRHLLTLINDILDLSKIDAGKVQFSLEEFEVERLMRDLETTIRPMVTKNHNRFDMVIDGELGTMYSDAIRVKQVLLNLLSNACKFTTRGRIMLMVRRETTAAGASLSFIVNDTGIGMTQDQVTCLFEPFTQADRAIAIKYGGTGLGLAISRRLCQLMGGDIRVHSDIGVGTNFTVRLPAETVAQVEPAAVSRLSS